jgi:hypothetical protein
MNLGFYAVLVSTVVRYLLAFAALPRGREA